MKVLTMVPIEGEAPEDFSKRAAAQVQEFFGVAGDAEEASAPVDETEEPTDETAESEEAPKEEQPEG